MSQYTPKLLPPTEDQLESKAVLKAANRANKYLAKLNGISGIIPNQSILINTLILQEAKNSSEVENVMTTLNEVYQSEIDSSLVSPATKEVKNYSEALLKGWQFVKKKNYLQPTILLRYKQSLIKQCWI